MAPPADALQSAVKRLAFGESLTADESANAFGLIMSGEATAAQVAALGYNAMWPGPVLRVVDGDRVRIEVTNRLAETTGVHMHGIEFDDFRMDGVPFVTQPPIVPGETFAYSFVAKPSGSHMYHSHHNATDQVGRGLLGALIVAIHAVSQRQLPLTFMGAGLPQLAGLAGRSKSYAERLFDFPEVGALADTDAKEALREPITREDVAIEADALQRIVEKTYGYPYFLQEWGYNTWNTARDSPITASAARGSAWRFCGRSKGAKTTRPPTSCTRCFATVPRR